MKHSITSILIILSAVSFGKSAAFIQRIEGFRPSVYLDSTGRRTIGYGFTSARLVGRERITETEATAELKRICNRITARLRRELGHGNGLTAQEEAAVVSFIYNVGWNRFKASTMFRLLKAGKRGEIVAREFTKWVYVTRNGRKVFSGGLHKRRQRERLMFMG